MIEIDYTHLVTPFDYDNDIVFDNAITASEMDKSKMYFVIYVVPSFLKLCAIPEILETFYSDLFYLFNVSIRAVLSKEEKTAIKNRLLSNEKNQVDYLWEAPLSFETGKL